MKFEISQKHAETQMSIILSDRTNQIWTTKPQNEDLDEESLKLSGTVECDLPNTKWQRHFQLMSNWVYSTQVSKAIYQHQKQFSK